MNELLVADMALVMSSMGVSLLFLLGYTRSLLMSFVGLVQARWLPPPTHNREPYDTLLSDTISCWLPPPPLLLPRGRALTCTPVHTSSDDSVLLSPLG